MKKYNQLTEVTIKSKFVFWEESKTVYNYHNGTTSYNEYHAYWNYIIWFPVIAYQQADCGMFFVTKDNIKNIIKQYEKI